MCRSEAHSNKEIAQALGKDPATVLHHVRTLVDTGFLAAQEVRRGTRGSREIPYLATGKSWAISTPGQGKVLLETFVEEVAAVPAEDVDTARLGLRLNAENLENFKQRMQELFDEFAGVTGRRRRRPLVGVLRAAPRPEPPRLRRVVLRRPRRGRRAWPSSRPPGGIRLGCAAKSSDQRAAVPST